MSEGDRLQLQRRKIEEQDELIENMLGLDKENKQISKAMTQDIQVQITQMEKVSDHMAKVGGRMNTTNNRFKDYLDNTSYCKLYLLIFFQAGIILYLLISII